MGMFRSMFSVLFKPIMHTTSTVAASGRRLKADLQRLKEVRERLHQQAHQQAGLGKGASITAAHLSDAELLEADPHSLKDPALRFRAMFLQQGWTESLIAQRMRAVKGRKYFGIALMLLMFFGGLVSIVLAPAWLALLMFAITVVGTALGAAITFLYGLFQSQLEMKSLHGAAVYTSRPDFFTHLVS